MPIRICNHFELQSLMEKLANEVVDASIYWRLHKRVQVMAELFRREVTQSEAFWSTAQQALLDATVFRLCKVYDDYRGALNLKNLLETIRDNAAYFDPACFRERMTTNSNVEELASQDRMPKPQLLAEDLAYVQADTNPLVKLLQNARNNLYAHHSARDVITQADLSVKYPMTKGQVDELLERAHEIVNRYSHLYFSTTFSRQLVGEEDYKGVFESLRRDLQQREVELHRQDIRFEIVKAWDEAEARMLNAFKTNPP
jgi:hypothetical protein